MKALKLVFAIFIALVLSVALFVGFVPKIASTPQGKEFLLSQLNTWIPGEIRVKNLHLSWMRASQIEGLELLDSAGETLAYSEQIRIHNPLWKLLASSNPEPLLDLHQVRAKIVTNEEGVTNIERALSSRAHELPEGTLLEPIIIENFEIESEFLSQLKRVKIAASGTTRQGSVQGNFKLQGDLGKDTQLSLETTKFPVILLDQLAQLKNPELAGLLRHFFNDELSMTLTIDKTRVEQEIASPGFSSSMTGKLEDGTFSLLKPMVAEFIVSPEALEHLKRAFKLPSLPKLSEAAKVTLQTKSLALPLKEPQQLSGTFEIASERLALGDLDLNQAYLSLQVSPFFPQLELETEFAGRRNGAPWQSKLHWRTQNRPLRASLAALLEQANEFQFSLLDKSQNNSIELSGDIDHEALHLLGSFATPQVYIEKFKLKSSGIPWDDLNALHLQGSFSAEKIGRGEHFFKVSRAPWSYERRSGETNLEFTAAYADLAFDGKLSAKNRDSLDFHLVQHQGRGNFNVSGRIKSDLSAQLSGQIEEFPVDILIAALPQARNYQDKIHALFGSSVSGKLHAKVDKMNGPVALSLQGERCDFKLDGKIENSILTLNQPLRLDVTLSKEVSDYFLDDIIPLLNSATHGEAPLSLTISETGFRVPLRDISVETLNIPSARLDLGRIYFTREGKLAQIIQLMNIEPKDKFSVWFTPLYFSLREGRLQLGRFDMLIADIYPVATWGELDFIRDRVKMDVGLTGKAITQSFGPLPLPKNYLLAIPLRGTTQNPHLDTTRVAAKLSSLAAMTAGPQGILVSALLQLASGSLTEKIPEPTTQPLPWDTDAPELAEEDKINFGREVEGLFQSIFGK